MAMLSLAFRVRGLTGTGLVLLCLTLMVMLAVGSPATWAHVTDVTRALRLVEQQEAVTQRIAKDLLLVALEIEPEANRERLRASVQSLAEALERLQNGHQATGIARVSDPMVTTKLASVDRNWRRVQGTVWPLAESGGVSEEQVQAMARLDPPLRRSFKDLALAYEEVLRHGDLYSIMGTAISYCQYENVLLEEISKEFLFIAYGQNAEQHSLRLAEAKTAFETNLASLIDGNPELRLLPAPTLEIRAQLQAVRRTWQDISRDMETALLKGRPDPETILDVTTRSETLSQELEKAVQMYEAL